MKLIHYLTILSIISFVVGIIAAEPIKYPFEVKENPDNTNQPFINAMKTYDDTLFIQISRVEKSPSVDEFCPKKIDKLLSIYTINTDDIPNIPDFPLSFKSFNIPMNDTLLPVNFCFSNPFQFYPVKNDSLLVIYATYTDKTDYSTYEDRPMIVKLIENTTYTLTISETRLGPAYVDPITKQWSQANITLNVNSDKGFLRVASKSNNNNIITLQQFEILDDDSVQNITTEVELTLPINPNTNLIKYIATIDEGYAIIYANLTTTTGGIYGIFLNYNETPSENIQDKPVILYQLPNLGLNFTGLYCDNTFTMTGRTCVLGVSVPSQPTFYIIKIDFSSGVVNNVQTIQAPGFNSQYKFMSLPFGGYFASYTIPATDYSKQIYGYLSLNDNGIFTGWNLTNPNVTNFKGDFVIFSKNLLVLPQQSGLSGRNLSLFIDNLPIKGIDNGYNNVDINDTFPKIDGNATNATDVQFLSIKYHDKVTLSDGNLTIFELTDIGEEDIIRQTITGDGDYVGILDDYTVNVTIIESTFNNNATYFVTIDNGFVKSRDFNRPIIGIKGYTWNFIILNQNEEVEEDKEVINGRVRLTQEGTYHFENLTDKTDKQSFYANLTNQLATAIPISANRVKTSEKFEFDTENPSQITLSIDIDIFKPEKSAISAAKDLNNLIKNKFVSVFASGNYSKYLDSEYGFTFNSSETDENVGVLGTVRLTPDGTAFVEPLELTQFSEFFGNLTSQLANATSISAKRVLFLGTDETNETNATFPNQLILNIGIKRNKTERSAYLAARDLNYLIRDRRITVLESGDASQYLDDEYGYQIIPRWIEVNWTKLVATAILEILLFLTFTTKNYSAIFECGYSIADFVTGVIFAFVDSQNYPDFYIASVFFAIFPIIINLGYAFKITIDELIKELTKGKESNGMEKKSNDEEKENNNEGEKESNDEGEKESNNEVKRMKEMKNKKKRNMLKNTVVIFTLLGGINIENLNLLELPKFGLNINLSGLSRFNMMKGTIINTFLEKIPQIFIQSFFMSRVITFGYVPVLKLSFSTYFFISNIIKLYKYFKTSRSTKVEHV